MAIDFHVVFVDEEGQLWGIDVCAESWEDALQQALHRRAHDPLGSALSSVVTIEIDHE
jgi:hypothetical protein